MAERGHALTLAREALEAMGLKEADIIPLRLKEGIALFRVACAGKRRVLKLFSAGKMRGSRRCSNW